MRTLEEMSLIKGLHCLAHDNDGLKETLFGVVKVSKLVFMSLASKKVMLDNEEHVFDPEKWLIEIEARKDALQKECAEYYQDISKLIICPMDFNLIYKMCNKLLKRVAHDEFVFSPSLMSKLENLRKNETFSKNALAAYKESGLDMLDFLEKISQMHANEATIYKNFLIKMLNGCIIVLGMYFDAQLRENAIALNGEENLTVILETIDANTSLNKRTKLKLITELTLADKSLLFGGGWTVVREMFKNSTSLAKSIDALVKSHVEIIRISYLQQALDHSAQFLGGYCNLDVNAWLEVQDNVAQKLKNPLSFEKSICLQETIPCRYTPDFLKTQTGSDGEYLAGKDFRHYSEDVSSSDVAKICSRLVVDLQNSFSKQPIKGLKISIGYRTNNIFAHVMGLKRVESGFLFRDVNQGLFLIKDLKSLVTWLPQYVTTMGYQAFLKSYHIDIVSACKMAVPMTLSYQMVRKELERLSLCQDIEQVDICIIQKSKGSNFSVLDTIILSAISLEKSIVSRIKAFESSIFAMVSGQTTMTAENNDDFFSCPFLPENLELLSSKYKLPQETQRYNMVQEIYQLLLGEVNIGFTNNIQTILLSLKSILHVSSLEQLNEWNEIFSNEELSEQEKVFSIVLNLLKLLKFELQNFQFRVCRAYCRELEVTAHPHTLYTPLLQYTGLTQKNCSLIIDYLGECEAKEQKEAAEGEEVISRGEENGQTTWTKLTYF